MVSRQKFLEALRSAVGKPYQWGGNGPTAFDCSGVACHCLRAAGFPIADISSAGIADTFHSRKVLPAAAEPGSLFFYGKTERVTHVMCVLERWPNGVLILAGARGGTQKTADIQAAKCDRAFVDVCFGDYWFNQLLFAIDPFRGQECEN
jgi:hypothetical protein